MRAAGEILPRNRRIAATQLCQITQNGAIALHQQCLAHLLRRCAELLETAVGGAARFPRAVKEVLQQALACLPAGRPVAIGMRKAS